MHTSINTEIGRKTVYIDDHMANENIWKTFFEELPMGSRLAVMPQSIP